MAGGGHAALQHARDEAAQLMAVTLNQLYLEICNVILEPGGFSLGLVTLTDFANFAQEICTDFLTKTEIIKKIICVDSQAGVDTVTLPDTISDTIYCNYNQSYLHRTSGFYLDNSNAGWSTYTNAPTTWRQDEVQPKQLSISPIPDVDGSSVQVALGQGVYGTISGTSNANVVDINASMPLFGTIGGFDGPVYLEVTAPMFGTIAAMSVSATNLEMIASAVPELFSNAYVLSTMQFWPLQLVPDSCSMYLKYGILARIFGSDGEMKDLAKSQYASERYQEGLALWCAIMSQELDPE